MPQDSSEANERYAGLVDRFCTMLEAERNASPHTVRSYRADLASYGSWADRAGVDPLGATHREVRGYLSELDRAAYSRRTINRHLSALRSFFRWAVEIGSCKRSSGAEGGEAPAAGHICRRDGEAARRVCGKRRTRGYAK